MLFDRPEDVLQLVSGKLALKYSGSEIEAMKEISHAAKKRSLADFQKVRSKQPLIMARSQ